MVVVVEGCHNLIDVILLFDLHKPLLKSINLEDMILSYDSINRGSTTKSLLTMINDTLIKDIKKGDIGAFRVLFSQNKLSNVFLWLSVF